MMSKAKGSPRKFSEKIALLNKNQVESNAEFEKIIKEVEESTRVSPLSRSPTIGDNRQCNSYHQNSAGQLQWAPIQPNQTNPIVHYNAVVEEQQLPLLDSFVSTSPGSQTQQIAAINHQPLNINVEQQVVPNIKIFPSGDDAAYVECNNQLQQVNAAMSPHHSPQAQQHQQYQQHHHHQQQQPHSNYPLISGARSLPDIANLRVSGSATFIGNAPPAYRDQRLPSDSYHQQQPQDGSYHHQETYYVSSNIEGATSQQPQCSNLLISNDVDDRCGQQQMWQTPSGFPQQQQDCTIMCLPPQPIPISRASSTNAISTVCWPTTATTETNANSMLIGDGATLSTSRPVDSNLSQGCYNSYVTGGHHSHHHQMNAYSPKTPTTYQVQQQQQPMMNVYGHRFRSSSYNSLSQAQRDDSVG